jgi:negative regulator of flagellin synthesis FlgM
MVDSIKNSFSRVDPHQKGRTADVSAGTAKGAAKTSVPASSGGTTIDVKQTVVAEMAKAPPIDKKAVQRIKEAISRGDYPINLERVSDALMDAYRELKD